jgi:hypothetical protein
VQTWQFGSSHPSIAQHAIVKHHPILCSKASQHKAPLSPPFLWLGEVARGSSPCFTKGSSLYLSLYISYISQHISLIYEAHIETPTRGLEELPFANSSARIGPSQKARNQGAKGSTYIHPSTLLRHRHFLRRDIHFMAPSQKDLYLRRKPNTKGTERSSVSWRSTPPVTWRCGSGKITTVTRASDSPDL